MFLLAPFRAVGRRFFRVIVLFAMLSVAGLVGSLISFIFGLSGDTAMMAMFASYFLPLGALALWFGLRSSN